MDDFGSALGAWAPFFGAQIPAGAALLGLLFIGLSLNLTGILAARSLSRRAEIALILILLHLVVSSCALIPDQPARAFAAEVGAAAGLVWVATALLTRDLFLHCAPERRGLAIANFALLQAATLPFLAGAALLALGQTPAMHLIALGAILCVVKPALDAWVLLVEIHR